MKQSLGILAVMGASLASVGAQQISNSHTLKPMSFKLDYSHLPATSRNTGSHHAKSSHKQNRRKEIARRRA